MYCRQCSYQLKGVESPRCPECGREFDSADRRTFRARKYVPLHRRRWFLVMMCILLAYVGSYLYLSRRGIALGRQWQVEGFYFFPPFEETDFWRLRNYGCACFYFPLLVIEDWLGTGKGFSWDSGIMSVSGSQTPPPTQDTKSR